MWSDRNHFRIRGWPRSAIDAGANHCDGAPHEQGERFVLGKTGRLDGLDGTIERGQEAFQEVLPDGVLLARRPDIDDQAAHQPPQMRVGNLGGGNAVVAAGCRHPLGQRTD